MMSSKDVSTSQRYEVIVEMNDLLSACVGVDVFSVGVHSLLLAICGVVFEGRSDSSSSFLGLD